MIEIDPCEIQMTVVESGLQARNLGTEPASYVAVGMNRDPHLTLLYDGVDFDCAKRFTMNPHVHLSIRLQIGDGIRNDGWARNRGRCRR